MEHLSHRTANESTYYRPLPQKSLLDTTTKYYYRKPPDPLVPAPCYSLQPRIKRILVCPRTSKSWDCFERNWGFLHDCAVVRRLGNRGWSQKSTKNKLVDRSFDKQSESVNVQPERIDWFVSLRVEFLLKTDSGYPKEKGDNLITRQTLGIPSAITLLGQLYESPPSPIPGT